MTTLAAYIEPGTGRTWVGWDSRVTQGHGYIVPTMNRKMRRLGAWWIGFAGNLAALDHLEDRRADIEAAGDDLRRAVKIAYDMFGDLGYKRCDDHSGPPCYEQYGLWVRRGEIFTISGSGAICRMARGFGAEGSGSEYAMGAFAALLEDGPWMDGEDLIRRALTVAATFDQGTAGPFSIEEVFE